MCTESSKEWWKAAPCPLPLLPGASSFAGRTMPRDTVSCLCGPGSYQQHIKVSAWYTPKKTVNCPPLHRLRVLSRALHACHLIFYAK